MTQPDGNVVASRVGTACTQLTGKGYCVLEDVVDAGEIERLSRDLSVRFAQTPFCDGDFYGRSTKRFGGLLRHSAHAAALVKNSSEGRRVGQGVVSPCSLWRSPDSYKKQV